MTARASAKTGTPKRWYPCGLFMAGSPREIAIVRFRSGSGRLAATVINEALFAWNLPKDWLRLAVERRQRCRKARSATYHLSFSVAHPIPKKGAPLPVL